MKPGRVVLSALVFWACPLLAGAQDLIFKDGFESTAVCGNETVELGETCDGNDLGGQDCAGLGFLAGTLACSPSCASFDTSGCTNCGNELIDAGEACDGNDLGGETCVSQGFVSGFLACGPDCTSFDTSGCVP